MDDLIQWEPHDNQHLISDVRHDELRRLGVILVAHHCSLCDGEVYLDDKYCGRCGARLYWKEVK